MGHRWDRRKPPKPAPVPVPPPVVPPVVVGFNLVDAFAQVQPGGTINVPTGTFTTGRVDITKAGITIVGASKSVTILKASPNSDATILYATAPDTTTQDVQIDCNAAAQTHPHSAIAAYAAPRTTVKRCHLHNNSEAGMRILLALNEGSDHSIAQENLFEDGDNACISRAAYCQIMSNVARRISTEAFGAYSVGDNSGPSHDNTISGNTVEDSYVGFVAENAYNNLFTGNTAKNCMRGFSTYGIDDRCYGNVFDGNTVIGGPLSTGWGALHSEGKATGAKFLNNTVINWTLAAAAFGGVPGTIFMGNRFTGCKYVVLCRAGVFSNNIIESGIGHGIVIDEPVSGLTIEGNTITGCKGYAIYVTAQMTDCVIRGNKLAGNGGGDIYWGVPPVNCVVEN
jgi:parallel beta-helix repeat protein